MKKLTLLLAGIVIGGMLTGVASAGVDYLTKKEGDKRYLGLTKTVVEHGWADSVATDLKVNCPNGYSAIGGGVSIQGPTDKNTVTANEPFVPTGQPGELPQGSYGKSVGWYGRVLNTDTIGYGFTVTAVCSR